VLNDSELGLVDAPPGRYEPSRPRQTKTFYDKENLMGNHSTISPEEAADRLAIRELIDAYAHCADRRDAAGQMALFTEDTRFLVFMDGRNPHPSQEISRREDLAPVFENLNAYEATTHFNGQSTVVLDGDRASGESYCLAHHVSVADGKRSLMVASIRYLDGFAKRSGRWLFSERKLIVDWIETRSMS
jgi:ketosteroid isomerase-like protein